jgi:hypothetical protein
MSEDWKNCELLLWIEESIAWERFKKA